MEHHRNVILKLFKKINRVILFGKSNYDIWILKLDVNGGITWANTYGDYLNEYRFKIYATKEEDTFQVIGIKQDCKTINISNEYIMKDWKFTIDKNGELI